MNLGGNSMSLTSSNTSWLSNDVVPGKFPAGLRVLVVDDDPTCLKIVETMLKKCFYQVTKSNCAEDALTYLRDNKDGFDVVLSDVHMPDMDGFKLLEHVGLEMDLPVIMMSADDSNHVVMKGITHGACDYLIKPVRLEEISNIWQHVVRKRKHEHKDKDLEQSGSVEDGERQQKPSEDVDYSSSANEGTWRSSKKRKDEDDEVDERDDTSALKKPRVVWSVDLHQQFVAAVNQLGLEKAVPKKILELMNVPGLTRENVASHLQKYRLYLRRLSAQHHNGLGNSFMGPQDVPFGPPINSYSVLDLQALASSSQLPPQSLASIQSAALSRSASKSPVSVPLFDQHSLFGYDNSKIRQHHNNSKQVNLLHGIPANMDSKHLASLHQPSLPFSNMNVNVHPQLVQPRSRSQLLNKISSGHSLNLPSSVGQAVPGPMLGQYGINNIHAPSYTSLSQPSTVVDFPRTQGGEFAFPLGSNSGFNSKGTVTKEETSFQPLHNQYGQEDLMSVLLNQHQESTNEYGFTEYHLDNLPQ